MLTDSYPGLWFGVDPQGESLLVRVPIFPNNLWVGMGRSAGLANPISMHGIRTHCDSDSMPAKKMQAGISFEFEGHKWAKLHRQNVLVLSSNLVQGFLGRMAGLLLLLSPGNLGIKRNSCNVIPSNGDQLNSR